MTPSGALYVEIDKNAAAWLRELIKQGHIAPGDVYEGSLEDITPEECNRYAQVHLCAGIGVWSYALRLAGWPDDRPVWTASFPCQPFSEAGQGAGFADERHLWPSGHWLIEQCRPVVVLGEQVAAKLGLTWFDVVSSDLEGSGYAVGTHDLCAAGVGAPHIRQRLYFVAVAEGQQQQHRCRNPGRGRRQPTDCGSMVDAASEQAGLSRCAWFDGRPSDWVPCRDGKWRPVEPGTFPLAHGAPARVGRLRGYGNAIVAQVAEEFIRAVMLSL